VKYTYYIDFGAGNVQFIPDADAVYSWKEENKDYGFMRKSVKGLVLTKDYDNEGTLINLSTFDMLWEWYFDITKHKTQIKLQIFKDNILDYESLFYITDGDIDVNNGVYTIKTTTDDPYRLFLEYIEDEVDVIDGEGPYTVRYQYSSVLQEVDNGSDIIEPDDSGTWVYRNWYPPHLWVRSQSQFNIDGYTGGIVGKKIGSYWYYAMQGAGRNYYFPNCFLLTDTIQFLLDTILAGTPLAGMTFVSHFFFDPVNYVTGASNELMNTLIEQITDTKDPNATDKATIGKISFTNLMKDLKAMFNVRWLIEGTELRIEHEKYFYSGMNVSGVKTVGIDLTDATKYYDVGSGEMFVADTQNFIGAEIEKFKKETIKFPIGNGDFASDLNYIEYDVIDTVSQINEITITSFMTDIPEIIKNPSDVGDDGFFMFNCTELRELIKLPEFFNDTDYLIGNSGFSIKWLMHDYYEYGSQDKSGTQKYNGSIHPGDLFSVKSTKPVFIQKDIVFLLNNDDSIDINKYIASFLLKSDGTRDVINGEIINIEQDLYDDYIKVTLGFEL